jgi:hypothetical protein
MKNDYDHGDVCGNGVEFMVLFTASEFRFSMGEVCSDEEAFERLKIESLECRSLECASLFCRSLFNRSHAQTLACFSLKARFKSTYKIFSKAITGKNCNSKRKSRRFELNTLKCTSKASKHSLKTQL